MGNKGGMLLKFDKSMIKTHPCCDVSWISKFPNEKEVLFAKQSISINDQSTHRANDTIALLSNQEDNIQTIQIFSESRMEIEQDKQKNQEQDQEVDDSNKPKKFVITDF